MQQGRKRLGRIHLLGTFLPVMIPTLAVFIMTDRVMAHGPQHMCGECYSRHDTACVLTPYESSRRLASVQEKCFNNDGLYILVVFSILIHSDADSDVLRA